MDFILKLHSINRWLFLLFGLYAISKAALGLINKREYEQSHNISALLFVAVTHLQALLGLILYFARDWYKFLPQLGEYMKNQVIRFWSIEHLTGMLIAVVLIQIGRTRSRKAVNSRLKFKRSLLYFALGLLIVLITIPWPFREGIARGLFPQ